MFFELIGNDDQMDREASMTSKSSAGSSAFSSSLEGSVADEVVVNSIDGKDGNGGFLVFRGFGILSVPFRAFRAEYVEFLVS